MNRILIVAYACEPNATSEPGVGWKLAHEIAKHFPITVLTRANNKDAIENAVAADPSASANIQWKYVDLPHALQRLKKKLAFGTQLYYMIWQWKAYLYAKRLHRQDSFAIAHHLTFGVSWLAPPAALLRTKFVWGPIGGGDLVPDFIMQQETALNRAKEFAYGALVLIAYHMSPLARIARRKSAAIIFRNKSTQENFPSIPPDRAHVICETASDVPITPRHNQSEGGLSAICVGRMQYWKGYIYAVEGFHRFIQSGGKGTLTMLGDGPEFWRIREYCRRYNLEGQIKLHGKVPAAAVQRYLKESNALIHPSFRDGGSWAVLEAMINGLPVIAVNHSGSADMISAECGYLINARSSDELIGKLASALEQLEREPELRTRMGIAAQERVVSHYRWNLRGESLKTIYETILRRLP